MQGKKFSPGFRISMLDIFVLVLATVVTVILELNYAGYGMLVAFVVLHFFLFCNVFRISRALELCWAAGFIFLVGLTVFLSIPGWLGTYLLSIFITIGVVVIEIRQPSYHGVFWSTFNPGLKDW